MSIYGPVKPKAKKKHTENGKKKTSSDHSDRNMLVTIRVRPLFKDKVINIVSVEDNLLIVRDIAEIKYENEGIKPDVLHRSKEQRYYFDRIFKDTSQEEVYEAT